MACRRHVEELLPRVRAHYAGLLSKQDILALPAPHLKLANIPLIGTAGAVLSASVANHPALPALSRQVSAVMGAILDRRADGHSEGVAYDGYILDFIADWMRAAQRDERKEILDHPRLRDYLDESYMLAAPGSGMEVAAIGDVEPKEMPFHYSAQAKLARLQPDETRAWYLGQGRLEWIRADGLGSLAALSKILGKVPGGKEPPSGALNAHYAVALRSGWEKRDLAVAISCSTSPMSHLQNDNGTVVIGTAKKWIISDPGYEQYMKDAERDFTLGPAAHNYPLINGVAQDRKRPRLLSLKPQEPGCYQAKLELADCYPPNSRIRSVTRTVWLAGRAGVLIADQISADAVRTVAYHWHGHPEAAWWIQDSWVLLHMPDVDLWFTSPQVRISQENILRLPGSRGHLTLLAEAAEPIQPVIWWAFAIGNAAPEFRLLEDGRVTQFLGMRFEV